MNFLFSNNAFSYEALRVTGYACYGGADLGEVLVTARNIAEGDEQAWHTRWKALASRLEDEGMAALRADHRVSARETLLRASAYYRTSDFYQRDDPAHDPEVTLLSKRVQETFAEAAQLLDPPAERLSIPFEGAHLPGYFFRVDDSGLPRSTLIYHGGYDSVLEEAYFAAGAAAVRRGYNCLAFDGPGQGAVLREQKLPLRLDWEKVVGAVIDFALDRSDTDGNSLVLMGTSLGGFLAARAAAFEHRIAALILHDGIYDMHKAGTSSLPSGVVDLALSGADAEVDEALAGAIAWDTELRWFLHNGKWVFGVDSTAGLIRATVPYTLDGLTAGIRCATLVLEAENDVMFAGQPQLVADALECKHDHIVLTDAEGAGEHCHEGAMLTFHRRAFDWLDDTLANRR